MSPRAAWRLESLGFSEVYDYAAGEADWFANGLPREGRDAAILRAGVRARRDVPICNLNEQATEVQQRIRASGWNQCVVVNDDRVVLGLLHDRALDAAPGTPVERMMVEGPSTIRPDTQLKVIRDRLQRRDAKQILVTTADGRLVGVLRREDTDE